MDHVVDGCGRRRVILTWSDGRAVFMRWDHVYVTKLGYQQLNTLIKAVGFCQLFVYTLLWDLLSMQLWQP